ncbi:MAG: hypothetical protein NZ933_05535 [Bacteroidia bacterium]|nr:hypothetical protein [Bacteroidia bacterium]
MNLVKAIGLFAATAWAFPYLMSGSNSPSNPPLVLIEEEEGEYGPRRRAYRTQLARAYFGKRAGCRRGSFCGR